MSDLKDIVEEDDSEIADLDVLANVESTAPTGLHGIKQQKRIGVSLTLSNGESLSGQLGIRGGVRLSDFLNQSKDFIVLIDKDNIAHIVNRHCIVQVVEVELG